MSERVPKGLGLGGDGDEIFAITDVERAFGLKLDYADAPKWRTAGDLFASLCKVLPATEGNRDDVWQRFATALAAETGVDPQNIEPASPLLSESRFWARLADVSAILWIATLVGFVIFVAAIALT